MYEVITVVALPYTNVKNYTLRRYKVLPIIVTYSHQYEYYTLCGSEPLLVTNVEKCAMCLYEVVTV
jgi:hypothetical protein